LTWIVYVRRSYKRADSADVSDETQESMARAVLPPGAIAEVIRDSGGHQSGATADRDGYQELLARLRGGRVAGIAVYDLSRLHRNALNMLALSQELERRRVPLLVATMPGASFDGANGRFMFGQLALAAQWQRDMDSDRMVRLTRSIFEAGGHRGLDPFGYRTVPDVKPRTLEVVPEEAAVVLRIWTELPTTPTEEIAQGLNRDGIRHRADRPWTRDAVKDIVRRGRFYLGFVTHRRGAEERPGKHPPILDEATWRAGTMGSQQRVRGRVRRSVRHRVYVLGGILRCGSCDHLMRGQASLSRGQEWRYYLCRHCPAPSVPAAVIEHDLRERLARGVAPDSVIDEARRQLRDRLALPNDPGKARRRLEARRDRLAQLYAWGDIPEDQYRAQRADVDRELQLLPSGDRLVAFDQHRELVLSLAEEVMEADDELLRELAQRVVAQAWSEGRALGAVIPTGPALPFFDAVAMAPPDGRGYPEATAWWLDEETA
jgi:DNA invertase Pin-like site-specific DNA recombinase